MYARAAQDTTRQPTTGLSPAAAVTTGTISHSGTAIAIHQPAQPTGRPAKPLKFLSLQKSVIH
jgi:hypothetical protein